MFPISQGPSYWLDKAKRLNYGLESMVPEIRYPGYQSRSKEHEQVRIKSRRVVFSAVKFANAVSKEYLHSLQLGIKNC